MTIISLRQTCRLQGKRTFSILVEAMQAFMLGRQPQLEWIAQGKNPYPVSAYESFNPNVIKHKTGLLSDQIETTSPYAPSNSIARHPFQMEFRRIEALNGIFQAAKCRARGYRNDQTFISIMYFLAAPIQKTLFSA